MVEAGPGIQGGPVFGSHKEKPWISGSEKKMGGLELPIRLASCDAGLRR